MIEELMIKAKMFYARLFFELSKTHFSICLDTGEEIVEEKSILELMIEEGE
jgi:hypothetical protein